MDFLSNMFNTEKIDALLMNIEGVSIAAEDIGKTLIIIANAFQLTNFLLIGLIISILLNTIVMWKRKR